MRRGGDGDDVAMRTTMRSKLDVGEVEEEKTKRTDIYKNAIVARRTRACVRCPGFGNYRLRLSFESEDFELVLKSDTLTR